MSGDSSWASPGWQPDPTAPGGSPGTPAGDAGAASTPSSPYGATPGAPLGWTPPPKPGLIPLRPLDFGTVLGATFQVLRRNPRPTFGAALLLNALVVVLSTGISLVIVVAGVDRITRANEDDLGAIVAGTVALAIVSLLLAVAISIVAQAVLQGVISLEVSRGVLGEKRTLRELVQLGRGRWWALIGWTALLGTAVSIAIALVVGLAVVFFALGDVALAVVGALLLVVGLIGGIVLWAWLSTKLAFVPAAIMLERLPLGAAIGRAWRLVRGAFWRVFGTLLLVTVMVNVAASIVTTPVQLAASFAVPITNPAGQLETDLTLYLVLNLVVIVVTAVVGAIGSVLTTSAQVLLYLDRRIRLEGLDLELQRVVELRAAGVAVDDPYVARAAPATPPPASALPSEPPLMPPPAPPTAS